ncbi:MAG TPA: toll/interleukin-1 receptor domain-containing protein, partial [Bryobacteraceae bacterium]|nr:toll/interleukin-1 receptor domain-containing protein [Bryobacteraceae bacterium]
MPSIFISYRREDTSPYAGRLYDHLSARFGADRVFMDLDTIRPGDDFVQVISDRVAACDVLIAVIRKRWLGTVDSQGRRRLDDPRDFVRV